MSISARHRARVGAGIAIMTALLASCDTTAPHFYAYVAFTGQPTSVTSMQSLGIVSVVLRDSVNQVVTGAVGTIQVTLVGSTDGRLYGTSVDSIKNGGVTYQQLKVDRVGDYHLVAKFSGFGPIGNSPVDSAVSATFHISAGPASRVAFLSQLPDTTDGVAAGTRWPPVRVGVTDVGGNPIASASASITLALDPTDSLFGTTTRATELGVATFDSLSVHKSRKFRLVATATGLATDSSARFLIALGPITHIVFTQQPPGGIAGQSLSAFIVEGDAYGNLRSDAFDPADHCTIRIENNPGGATLLGDTTSLYLNGFNFTSLKIEQPGNGYTLRAHHSQYGDAVSAPFDISP